jgi:hypothetical protein
MRRLVASVLALGVTAALPACRGSSTSAAPTAGSTRANAAPAPSATAPRPAPEPARAPSDAGPSCADFGDAFPSTELTTAAKGCAKTTDCVAVRFGGACWPVTRETLASPTAELYRAWSALGCNRPSGSPDALVAIDTSHLDEACGADWAGVECAAGTCALTPSDCAYGGMNRTQCTAKGGQWGGCIPGRGRSPGCRLPTRDAGKACTDSDQCESACVEGKCWGFTGFRGCLLRGGKTECVE